MLRCGMYMIGQKQETAGVGPACKYRKDFKNG